MMTRFTLILPAAATLIVFEAGALWARWRAGVCGKALFSEIGKRFIFSALVPVGLFFLVLSGLYNYLQITSFTEAPQKIISELFTMRELVRSKMESTTENFFFLGQAMTWPVLAAAFAGLALAWKQKRPETGVLAFWALGFWFYHSVVIFNKEARYLFPLLPPFYYFAALGILQTIQTVSVLTGQWQRRAILFFAVLCFLFLPLRQALSECLRFSNPVYTADYAKRVSDGAVELAGERGKIYWAGKLYALHDRDPLFHPDDEYTYLYHVYGHTLMFYSGRWIDGFPQARFFKAVDPETEKGWAMAVGLGIKLEDGDVLVMNLEQGSYNVRNLPAHLNPLLAARVRITAFDLEDTNAVEPRYRSRDALRGNLTLLAREGNIKILTGQGFTAGFYEVYCQSTEGKRLWQGIAHSGRQGLQFRLPPTAPQHPSQIFLLTYDEIRQYPHPD